MCCSVETPNCYNEKVINDVTCTNTVEFNCKRENDGYGQKEVICRRTLKQDCYNIPGKVIFVYIFLKIFSHFPSHPEPDPSRGVQD